MKIYLNILSALLLASSLFVVACDNDPEPGIAEIKVINAAGLDQAGIKVQLYCTEPGCVVRREGRTNSVGVYTESFDLPVVLRVRAVRYDTTITKTGTPPNQREIISVDSLCGEGFVQIENDEIAKETITIFECN